jgi:multiple sugar transport system permease protein
MKKKGRRVVPRKVQAGRLWRKTVLYAVLVGFGAIFFVPFLWMLSTSIKPPDLVTVYPPVWIPPEPKWENYVKTWQTVPFGLFTRNTVYIALLVTLGSTLSASLVAFGFARIRFPGRDVMFALMLSTMMLPGIVTLIPGYILFRELGWIDTLRPLWVPSFFGGGAFFVFLLRQFFRTIPAELDEAARIDGASWLSIYWRVLLPLSAPALTTVALFSFIGAWRDFMGPLIFINSLENQTLELGLQTFQTLYGTQYELLMAGAVLVVLPLIVIFFVGQRFFIQGIVMTGLKG